MEIPGSSFRQPFFNILVHFLLLGENILNPVIFGFFFVTL